MSASPCFVHCGKAACRTLGCIHVYNAQRARALTVEDEWIGCVVCRASVCEHIAGLLDVPANKDDGTGLDNNWTSREATP